MWPEAEITRAVGWSGIAALTFATFAMIHRSWARLPLVAVCVLSGLLITAGFFTEYDPSAMTTLGHLFLEVLLIAAGSIAGAITILDFWTRTSTTRSPHGAARAEA
jgi:asparagine N-glycosylation enzyme membrane subunit Stt3